MSALASGQRWNGLSPPPLLCSLSTEPRGQLRAALGPWTLFMTYSLGIRFIVQSHKHTHTYTTQFSYTQDIGFQGIYLSTVHKLWECITHSRPPRLPRCSRLCLLGEGRRSLPASSQRLEMTAIWGEAVNTEALVKTGIL